MHFTVLVHVTITPELRGEGGSRPQCWRQWLPCSTFFSRCLCQKERVTLLKKENKWCLTFLLVCLYYPRCCPIMSFGVFISFMVEPLNTSNNRHAGGKLVSKILLSLCAKYNPLTRVCCFFVDDRQSGYGIFIWFESGTGWQEVEPRFPDGFWHETMPVRQISFVIFKKCSQFQLSVVGTYLCVVVPM